MAGNGDPKSARVVTIDLGDAEGRIETLSSGGSSPDKIRISCWSPDHASSRPVDLTEKDLADMLYQAIRAGILSPDFLKDLHADIEI